MRAHMVGGVRDSEQDRILMSSSLSDGLNRWEFLCFVADRSVCLNSLPLRRHRPSAAHIVGPFGKGQSNMLLCERKTCTSFSSRSSSLAASIVVVVARVFLCSMFERKDCVRPWIPSLAVPVVLFSRWCAHSRAHGNRIVFSSRVNAQRYR